MQEQILLSDILQTNDNIEHKTIYIRLDGKIADYRAINRPKQLHTR